MLERATHLKELRLEHAKLKQLPASFGCLVLLEYVLPGGF
jgi:leucine-rich repeat protein SHOC2